MGVFGSDAAAEDTHEEMTDDPSHDRADRRCRPVYHRRPAGAEMMVPLHSWPSARTEDIATR